MFANYLAGKQIQQSKDSFIVSEGVFRLGNNTQQRETKFTQMCENTVNSQLATIVDTVAFDDKISNILDVINIM